VSEWPRAHDGTAVAGEAVAVAALDAPPPAEWKRKDAAEWRPHDTRQKWPTARAGVSTAGVWAGACLGERGPARGTTGLREIAPGRRLGLGARRVRLGATNGPMEGLPIARRAGTAGRWQTPLHHKTAGMVKRHDPFDRRLD